MVAHIASGFESWIVLKDLVKERTDLKLIKTARGLISLSFRCGVKIIITVEVPEHLKLTFGKSHIKSSLEKVGREKGLQPELLRGEIEHSGLDKRFLLI